MNGQKVEALFLLAGIEVIGKTMIPNRYWGSEADAYKLISDTSPWWEVVTPFGKVDIGWRKRVINIDWSKTEVRGEITKDDVTKDSTNVHAWSYANAVTYLTALEARAIGQGILREARR